MDPQRTGTSRRSAERGIRNQAAARELKRTVFFLLTLETARLQLNSSSSLCLPQPPAPRLCPVSLLQPDPLVLSPCTGLVPGPLLSYLRIRQHVTVTTWKHENIWEIHNRRTHNPDVLGAKTIPGLNSWEENFSFCCDVSMKLPATVSLFQDESLPKSGVSAEKSRVEK
uniref:Uncharacterized protein n=1 Tax=Molossus molossus TaxID=27622 RepID=A0A7J8J0C6_MOLMO|nr:hypothetical protein HJG59_010324 [Molossus molossus]